MDNLVSGINDWLFFSPNIKFNTGCSLEEIFLSGVGHDLANVSLYFYFTLILQPQSHTPSKLMLIKLTKDDINSKLVIETKISLEMHPRRY